MEKLSEVAQKNDKPSNSIGDEFKKLFSGKEFQESLRVSGPIFAGTMLAWPFYWIYRGFEWNKKRGSETLPSYIHKTYYQAKLLQMGLLTTGIITIIAFNAIHSSSHDKHN